MARAGADDVFAVGLANVVLPAVQQFSESIKAKCNLELQWTKCKVYKREGDLPPNTPQRLTLAGEMVDGEFQRGFICFGIPLALKHTSPKNSRSRQMISSTTRKKQGKC